MMIPAALLAIVQKGAKLRALVNHYCLSI